MTFQTVLTHFLLYCKPKPSALNYERIADQYFRAWQDWPTFAQLDDWHRSVAARPHHANKALALLKTMSFWAMRRGYFAGPNPALGVKRHPTFSRERVMSSREVAVLLSCLDMIPLKLSAMLQVLLLTGCRLNEARHMQWQDVNMDTGQWVQPKTKNGKPHVTYLPTQARHAIAALPRTCAYVFAGIYEHCWSGSAVEKNWRLIRGTMGLGDVRLHDFRRTLATHLYQATKDDYLVKRCINHVNVSVTAIYVRISQEEVAAALQAQADRFSHLINQEAHHEILNGVDQRVSLSSQPKLCTGVLRDGHERQHVQLH